MKDGMWSRSQFLKVAGLAVLGRYRVAAHDLHHGSPDGDEIDGLLAESFVMDGNANLGMRRGKAYSPLQPGAIKKLTGISAGNHTVRPESIEGMNRRVAQNSQVLQRIDKASDIGTAIRSSRYGIAFYFQGGFDLRGSVELLSVWKNQGLRVLQLTMEDNELGGGTLGDDRPLTALGKRVVREMNRLGMIVDISHSGRRTTLDAAAASEKPITANHANVDAITRHSRNKSDEEVKAVAATGGVVAATPINRYFLRDPRKPGTLEDFVAHVDVLVQRIGIDHVGISSDSYMDGSQRYDVDYSDIYLGSPDRWRHVARRLSRLGYTNDDLKKILGLNFKRVYEAVLDP
jgi:membrane dipeptidase